MSRLCRLKTNTHGEDGKWAYSEIIRLRKDVCHQQSTIDALMLEFCPERMTREKMDEWEAHQKPAEQGCSDDPEAQHGFNRTASHSLGRYVCDCEGN